MTTLDSLLDELAALACPTGGWGYAPGQGAQIEPTCLALLALAHSDKHRDAVANGLRALQQFRHKDGSYRLDRGRDEAVWASALAILALRELRQPEADIRSSAAFLLGVRGKTGQEDDITDTAFDINVRLVGWPWAEGTFSWVEPTAWACLALQQLGQAAHPRVVEGLQVLLDRAFDAGGANYGNKLVLGKPTEPIPGPSAVLLLALQSRSAEPRVRAAIEYVRQAAASSNDVEHLALSKLALAALGHSDLDGLDQRIQESLLEQAQLPWAEPAPHRLALAAIALAAPRRNPFRLDAPTDMSAVQERPWQPPRKGFAQRIRGKLQTFMAGGLGNLRQPPTRSVVHVAKADNYDADLASIIRSQYEHFRDIVPLAGKRVVLKPNLVEYHRGRPINTDSRVVGAVIELCQKEGASEVIVAEGPGHWRNVQYLVAESGLGDVLQRYGVRFVDINHDEPEKLLNLGRLTGLDHLFFSKTVATAEVLISLPKLKTHHWAGATLSLKNLFGVLPGSCYGWPKNELHWRGIAQSIIDIALTCTPHLAIVDGIVGMEGDGPINGTPRHVGALLMGNDLVSVDATGCRIMGLPVERIEHIVLGARKKLGRMRVEEIEQLGEAIEPLVQKFELPPRFDSITLPA